MGDAAYKMREPCKRCGETAGVVATKNGQDTVRCAGCGVHCYNAPKVETGRATRTVTTVHNGIKPKQRSRVLERWGNRCAVCGATSDLHVGHALSVVDGLALGLTERVLNSDANLIAMCAECNLGLGRTSLRATVYAALLARELGPIEPSNDDGGRDE